MASNWSFQDVDLSPQHIEKHMKQHEGQKDKWGTAGSLILTQTEIREIIEFILKRSPEGRTLEYLKFACDMYAIHRELIRGSEKGLWIFDAKTEGLRPMP